MNERPTEPTDRFGELSSRLRQLLGRFHRDRSGATLTEFVIMLPIFVLIFNGVMVLGQFTRKGSEPPIRAYKMTFDKALNYQKNFFHGGWNIQPTAAGADSLGQLAGVGATSSSPAHNTSGAVQTVANVAEAAAYGGLTAKGTMGESYARTKAIATVPGVRLYGREGQGSAWPGNSTRLDGNGNQDRLTMKLKEDLVGESDYAFDLLNDGVSPGSFSGGGGGALSALNSLITATGIRPAFAAGIRYGTVSGRHTEDYTFAGRTMEMDAHFSVLVPPGTTGDANCIAFGQGPRCDAMRATATTRLTMQDQEHYKDLLGIDMGWGLNRVNQNVPDYP